MSESLTSLSAALSGRYTIERELGRGGTAIVYLAHDVKHDRKVALKVLNPELALAVRAERFLREIQIAAKLSHPHILPLYDSGEAAGMLFYVMPNVEGESLRDRLKREKQLPVDEALRITREVAAGLDEAHHQGVVHRDIKPENILLTRTSDVLVADFGIARALRVSGSESVTETGVVVGTTAYMSPEQAGGGEVDRRSDIYSLGCVLYEMLSGRPPFTGVTTQEILARHMLDPVPSLRAARPDVPETVEHAISKALAKAPVARLQTAAEFATALSAPHRGWRWRRAPIAAVGVGILLLSASIPWARKAWFHGDDPARVASENSLGVQVCLSLTGDSAKDYFSQGMTDEMIARLSSVPGLRVPALTSSLALKGKPLSVPEAAGTLGVANLLECTVRRDAGHLRMRVTLWHAADETQLWSETYDREVNDVIRLQEEIAREIVRALPSRLALASPYPHMSMDTAAYDLFLRGRFLETRHTLTQAISLYEQAIERDSNFAPAYAGLARAAITAMNSGFVPRPNGAAKASPAARKAVALQPDLADAHGALAVVLQFVDWNWADAEREYQTAIRLNPNASEVHGSYANLLGILGRYEEAREEAHLARRLDPQSTDARAGLALIYARYFDEAILELQRVATLVPDDPAVHAGLARAYVNAGRFSEAMAAVDRERALGGGSRLASPGYVGYIYARSGRDADARRVLADLRRLPRSAGILRAIVWVHLGLGDKDTAVTTLLAWVKERANPTSLADPVLDEVRADPRITQMRRSLGLKP